ncbi:hypothetical protein OH77DRAFT_1490304 [Trametes cingulata]|nr:hypothetical protein OH77DRAFT_1490304 [Trametes cingulata]
MKHRRSQRRDVKKARRRPVTNPNNDELRRPKRGVKSARYVLEPESEIEEYDSGTGDAGRGQKGGKYWLTEDPIEEFV